MHNLCLAAEHIINLNYEEDFFEFYSSTEGKQ